MSPRREVDYVCYVNKKSSMFVLSCFLSIILLLRIRSPRISVFRHRAASPRTLYSECRVRTGVRRVWSSRRGQSASRVSWRPRNIFSGCSSTIRTSSRTRVADAGAGKRVGTEDSFVCKYFVVAYSNLDKYVGAADTSVCVHVCE